jgi:hypothetical protein
MNCERVANIWAGFVVTVGAVLGIAAGLSPDFSKAMVGALTPPVSPREQVSSDVHAAYKECTRLFTLPLTTAAELETCFEAGLDKNNIRHYKNRMREIVAYLPGKMGESRVICRLSPRFDCV